VRELENAIERAVIIARSNRITLEDLRDEILHPQPVASAAGGARVAAEIEISRGVSFYDEVNRFQIDLIRRALELTNGHQSRAAKLLQMNTTTLNSKIKYFGIR
jgi:DNA-binding NtrC family response regulator